MGCAKIPIPAAATSAVVCIAAVRVVTRLGPLCLLSLGCRGEAPPPPRRADVVERAPEFPSLALTANARVECFPSDFAATRARLRGERLELCGLSGGASWCALVDPITTSVERVTVSDAPREAVSEIRVEAPLSAVEARTRGGSVSMRGGSLAMSYGGTRPRSVEARTAAVSTLRNAVVAPWSDGHFAALFGVRAPDLGATAIMDPATGRLHGHAAIEPCAPR